MAVDRIRNYPIIIFDTNALFIPFEFRINVDSELNRLFGEYEIIIPNCVLSEVQRLSRTERFGKMALTLAQKISQPTWYPDFEQKLLNKLSTEPQKYDENPIDNQILEIAKSINGIVLTNDRAFLKKLTANDVKTISLRKKKYLVTDFNI
jgi:rRNA-processing protein FCF1